MQNYIIYLRQAGRWILLIILMWFFIHLTKSWLKPYIIESLGGYTDREVVSKVDTTVVRIDSIFPVKREREVVVKYIPKPTIESTSDSTTKGRLYEPQFKKDSIYRYKTGISDSLIDGNITTLISLKDCKLVSQSLNYTPKFPILVEKTTVIETSKTEVLKNKNRVKIGVGITANSNISGGGMLIYQTPKSIQYQAGYIFTKENLNNQFKDKQGYISVSIIKLF